MNEHDWERLIGELRGGECTPFIGAGACSGVLPDGKVLSAQLADEFDYPFEDRTDLALVTQYGAILMKDSIYVRRLVADRLRTYLDPDIPLPQAHRALAGFPLPIYLTTNYDDLMSRALVAAGRRPRSEWFQWFRAEKQRSSRSNLGKPTVESPVVHHLHGQFDHPHTMVLTEDDYLEFLVNISMDQAANYRRIMPDYISFAIPTTPLLFVGYRLHDWTFRVLFSGLLKPASSVNLRQHVSIQLPPTSDQARAYYDEHFGKKNISIFWGSADEFCAELRRRIGPAT